MRFFSETLDFDDCESFLSGDVSDVPTPGPAYPTPFARSRSSTFTGAFLYSPMSSVRGSISSSANILTPNAAYPTATTSRRSSRAYSASFFHLAGKSLSAQVGSAFQMGNITTVLEHPSGRSSSFNSNPVSVQSITTSSGQVSPSTISYLDLSTNDHRRSSASSPLPFRSSKLPLPSRALSVSHLPTFPSSPFVQGRLSPPYTTGSSSPMSFPATDEQITSSTPAHPTSLEISTLADILEKYDPKSEHVSDIQSRDGQREMLRMMFLDNILHATARLHKHQWVMGATNEEYRSLCGAERKDLIHEDLSRYTQAIRDYEYWQTCSVQNLELDPVDMPPDFQQWGCSHALFELASHPATRSLLSPHEKNLLISLEKRQAAENYIWSQAQVVQKVKIAKRKREEKARKAQISRVLLGASIALVLLVLFLVIALEITHITHLATIGVSTVGIGHMLFFCMNNAHKLSLPRCLRRCSAGSKNRPFSSLEKPKGLAQVWEVEARG